MRWIPQRNRLGMYARGRAYDIARLPRKWRMRASRRRTRSRILSVLHSRVSGGCLGATALKSYSSMKMVAQWWCVPMPQSREWGEIVRYGGTPDQIYRARAGLPLRTVYLEYSQVYTHLLRARWYSRRASIRTGGSESVEESVRESARGASGDSKRGPNFR